MFFFKVIVKYPIFLAQKPFWQNGTTSYFFGGCNHPSNVKATSDNSHVPRPFGENLTQNPEIRKYGTRLFTKVIKSSWNNSAISRPTVAIFTQA